MSQLNRHLNSGIDSLILAVEIAIERRDSDLSLVDINESEEASSQPTSTQKNKYFIQIQEKQAFKKLTNFDGRLII